MLWLLKLPFRPVLRWFSAALVVVLLAGWWTGFLDLGARYVFWRYWPYSTPLIGQAPADAQSLLLVDRTRPQISQLASLAETQRVKTALQKLAATLDIDPRYDLLQLLLVVDARARRYTIYAGRFMRKTTRAALEKEGWQAQPQAEGLLFQKGGRKDAWLWQSQRRMVHGPLSLLAAEAKLLTPTAPLSLDAQLMDDLQNIGNRQTLLVAMRPAQDKKSARFYLSLNAAPAAQVDLRLHLFPHDKADKTALFNDVQRALGPLKRGAALLAGDEVNALLQSAQVEDAGLGVVVRSRCTAQQLAALIGKSEQPAGLLKLTMLPGIKKMLGGLMELLQ